MLPSADKRPLVLIVDDDLAVRDSLAAVMEAFGFRTRTACNGAEGLEAIETEMPSAVITDLQMPKMNGLELISALRRDGTGLPVIAISGGDIEAAKRAGAVAAFHKPFPVFDMVDAVNELTHRAA